MCVYVCVLFVEITSDKLKTPLVETIHDYVRPLEQEVKYKIRQNKNAECRWNWNIEK